MRGAVYAAFTDEGAGMGIDHGAFRHDEPARSPLGVVVHHHVVGNVCGAGSRPGEWRHDDAVGYVDVPGLQRGEQRGHWAFLCIADES